MYYSPLIDSLRYYCTVAKYCIVLTGSTVIWRGKSKMNYNEIHQNTTFFVCRLLLIVCWLGVVENQRRGPIAGTMIKHYDTCSHLCARIRGVEVVPLGLNEVAAPLEDFLHVFFAGVENLMKRREERRVYMGAGRMVTMEPRTLRLVATSRLLSSTK